jgi:hypothetical protein
MNGRFLPAVAGVILALSLAASCGLRAGNVVLIPAGFEGWIIVRYQVQGAPALDFEGAKSLIRVPDSGSVSTSSDRPQGYGSDDYYFVGPGGKRVRVQSGDFGCKQEQEPCVQRCEFITSPVKVTTFFVGPKEDLVRYTRPKLP